MPSRQPTSAADPPRIKPPAPSRRRFLKKTAAAAVVGAGAVLHAPYAFARTRTRLRVLGTHVTLQEELRVRAERDLGIELVFEPGGSAAVLQKASTRPESFDVYEQWSNSLRVLWQAGAIQPVETARIEHWDRVNPLTKTGRLTPDAPLGQGDAPYKMLYVQPDGSPGPTPSDRVTFLPYVHNVDAFGYNTQVVPEGRAYETESWAWLLDERWAGRVGLVNEPTIGLFDAALAARAKGLVTFGDIGAMTRAELDALFAVLIDYKLRGHFNGIWNSVPQSIDFMERGQVVIESMFSPAIATLRGRGIPAVYAAPKEGYRAWHGVMCLSAAARGAAVDAAYDYMNWWLSGWPGAFIARQGYYMSVPDLVRPRLEPAEWDYWYDGKPAARDLPGTDGRRAVTAGSVRNGGDYTNRLSHVAVWNTVMDTYEYSLERWYEFLTA